MRLISKSLSRSPLDLLQTHVKKPTSEQEEEKEEDSTNTPAEDVADKLDMADVTRINLQQQHAPQSNTDDVTAHEDIEIEIEQHADPLSKFP